MIREVCLNHEHPAHDALVSVLAGEFQGVSQEWPLVVIFYSRVTPNCPRLLVVWDRWLGVKPDERSEIILEAFQEVHGRHLMVRVAEAIGLTPSQVKEQDPRYCRSYHYEAYREYVDSKEDTVTRPCPDPSAHDPA